jgi:hypothetical protein
MVPENDDEPKVEEKTEGVTVDPDDVETPTDKPAETEEQKQSRKERRQATLRDEKEARRQADERARLAEERVARIERDLAETRGYAAALGQRNQDDPAAARKTKIASLEDEADRHLANAGMAAAAKDQERAKAEMRAYNAKQREIAKLEFRAEMEPDIDQRFQQFQRQQPMAMTPQLLQARDSLQREFPWLTTNKRALDATDAEVDRRMRSGQQFSYEMARVVAAEVQRDLNLKINTPPSERSRAAYQAPGGGEGEGGGEGPVTVRMGKAEKTMAHKLYPGLDPAEAEKKWAREVGAPEARRQAKAGR